MKKNSKDNLADKDTKELKKNLNKTKTQKERLLNLYLTGDIEREAFKTKESELTKQKDFIENEVYKINQAKILLKELHKKSLSFETLYKKLNINLDKISYEDKCRVSKLLINRIETSGEGYAKVHCILPQRVGLHTEKRNFAKPKRK